MTPQEILSRLRGVKGGRGQWTALCPAHNDTHNSLSISTGRDGRILFNCHAGCSVDAIVGALGLSVKDLFEDKPHGQGKPQIEAIYTYPTGAQKLRKTDKSFSWRRPDGKGGWIYNRQGVPHSLYIAGKLEGPVYVFEGEKDVDNAHALGFNAASGADGAGPGKWRKEYTEQLRGLSVLIVPDHDDVGRAYAQETAAALHGVAKSVRLLDLSTVWPEIPEHGDASDLIEAKGGLEAARLLVELARNTQEWTEAKRPTQARVARSAADFEPDDTKFLWYPYIPIGDYSVMMADGGTGKTILCCGIAAKISTGEPLPGEVFPREPRNVLIISGEDSGGILRKRLELSGADLTRVQILDRLASEGMSIADRYQEFEDTIKAYGPALVIIDPWHCFVGEHVDISRVNAIRPILQRIANLAKICQCAPVMVSHVNKRAQGENANNAATGSTDFINAARSAFRVIFDETDEDSRIMVHTKSNYAAYGQSVKYSIVDGGVEWTGFSDITRQTLEAAARRKATPWEIVQKSEEREAVNNALIEALEKSANQFTATRYSYDEFKREHGELIFGGMQPKRALDTAKDKLIEDGFFLKSGIQVKRGGRPAKGFMIQKIDSGIVEQTSL